MKDEHSSLQTHLSIKKKTASRSHRNKNMESDKSLCMICAPTPTAYQMLRCAVLFGKGIMFLCLKKKGDAFRWSSHNKNKCYYNFKHSAQCWVIYERGEVFSLALSKLSQPVTCLTIIDHPNVVFLNPSRWFVAHWHTQTYPQK